MLFTANGTELKVHVRNQQWHIMSCDLIKSLTGSNLAASHQKFAKQNITKVNYLVKEIQTSHVCKTAGNTWSMWSVGFLQHIQQNVTYVYEIMCCHCTTVHILNKLIKSKYVHRHKINENKFNGYTTQT